MDPISGFFSPIINSPVRDSLECIYRSGGWCEIWRGVRDGQYRAYKCLKEPYRNEFLYQELLRKEFEITRELTHPGIRRCYSLTELEGLGYCIEMEYVEGDSLADLLERNALDANTAQTITAELLDTVAWLHRKGISHNDLKPSNILVSRKGGHIKLIDFGLADTDSWAILKLKGGTPTYAAPELQNAREGAGGQASDIYSLGVILAKLGTVPHRIVRHCCQPNPKLRWNSVTQIQEALDAKKKFPWPVIAAAVAILAPLLWFHNPVLNFVSSLIPVRNAPWGGLCIEAIEDGEIVFQSAATEPFEYSFDASHWIREDSLLTLKVRRRDCIYFRATNVTYTIRDMENSRYSHFSFSAPCYVYGNIMSLIDSTGFETAVSFTRSHNFAQLFKDNPGLRSHPTKKLLLPATDLSVGCYRWMFQNCTGLTEAPALPATELKGYCYQAMFEGCTSLETAPELPATKLSSFCYDNMFRLTGLRMVPELPAMSVPEGAYQRMFKDCQSLGGPILLPATELGERCYRCMFEACSSLTHGPEILPATKMEAYCYQLMFSRSGLTQAPRLPATELAEHCYSFMFSYCPAIEEAPVLPADTLADKCYMGMFQSSPNLTRIEVHAADISAPNCTTNWMLDTAPHGTFLCPADNPWPSNRSCNGIPKGWKVQAMDKT